MTPEKPAQHLQETFAKGDSIEGDSRSQSDRSLAYHQSAIKEKNLDKNVLQLHEKIIYLT